jgi:hypothetical protein
MDRADAGELVVVQENNEPRGVNLSYRHYESLLAKIDRLESCEFAGVAIPRRAEVATGEKGTTSLADMIAEFAPELRDADA